VKLEEILKGKKRSAVQRNDLAAEGVRLPEGQIAGTKNSVENVDARKESIVSTSQRTERLDRAEGGQWRVIDMRSV